MRVWKRITASILTLAMVTTSLLVWGTEPLHAASGDYIYTLAGTGDAASNGDGGAAAAAAVKGPEGIAIDSAGNLYIAEPTASRVRKVDKLTGIITTVAGDGVESYSGDGGAATSAQLRYPTSVALDSSGNLYIADTMDSRIRKVDTHGTITTFAGTGIVGSSGDGGDAAEAELSYPTGLAFDSAGNLFFAEGGTHKIRKINNSGIIETIAGTGSYGYSGNGGAAINARLNRPSYLAFDGSDNLYISDTGNFSIRKIDTSGIISTVLGQGSQGYTMEGELASSSYMGYPTGLAFDSAGNLYVSEYLYSTIKKIDTSGVVTTIAGITSPIYGGDGGLAVSAAVANPQGLAINSDGWLHIADSSNNRIRRIGPSNNANLGELSISNGIVSVLADIRTTNVRVAALLSTSSVTITPTVSDSNATVTVDGVSLASGSASSAINLSLGSNPPIEIEVTAPDGTTKTYSLTIIRASNNTLLSGITLSSGSIDFDSNEHGYWFSVGRDVSSITVTPTPIEEEAEVWIELEVNGALGRYDPGDSIDLIRGLNIIDIKIIAPDTITNTSYTLFVTRELNDDASLSGLALSSGGLDTAFASETFNYTAQVANNVSSLTITPTTTDSHATVKVNGTTVARGAASAAINLSVGENEIPVVATAQDGTTTASYTVTVTRAPSDNASLSGLILSNGGLDTAFASGTFNYTAQVANNVSSLTITPTTSESHATVTVDGASVASGMASAAINLSVGDIEIPVVVTAQDGTTTASYTVTVTRAPSDNASLSGLVLSDGDLSPAFASGTFNYTAQVANNVSSLTITPTTTDSHSTVTVDGASVTGGTESEAINLSVGENEIPVVVTAQDGATTASYTVTVTRAPSDNASLSGLVLSDGDLSPAFASGTFNYTAQVANNVSSLTITPATTDSHSTVTVDGASVTGGTESEAINLSVGENEIPVVVTAQDGTTTASYTVTVMRAAAPTSGVSKSGNADLIGLTLSSGTLNPVFASGTTSYAVSVENSVGSLSIKPFVSHQAATVRVNGTFVASGVTSGAISLKNGVNVLSVTVTAEDGATKTYTVTVTRENGEATAPQTPGPMLNEKIANALKVKEASFAALETTVYKPFADVEESNWSFQAIQIAQRLGIVKGRGDGKFHGSDAVTRAEFAVMVANALHLDEGSGVDMPYSDTKGHWAEGAIQALTAAGVVEGIGGFLFEPDQPISRAEASAVLARLIIFDESTGNTPFSDTTESWARPWIEQLAGADVLNGEGNGKFLPEVNTTREQAVAMILRMLSVCRNVNLQWANEGGRT
ncbi:cadherin-like beta sandwich domain-containing protein [Paenibacillus sp. strain BS8-2]